MARPRKPRTAPTRWDQVPLTMSIEYAASVCGVSRPTLAREIEAERLPVVRLGGRILVTQDALRSFLEQQAKGQAVAS